MTVKCIEGSWSGCYTHWVEEEGRKFGCTEEADCAWCRCLSQRPRWHGYVQGWMPNHGICFVEFTPHCLDLLRAIRLEDGSLLGVWLQFTREGRKQRSKVTCEVYHPKNNWPQHPEPSITAEEYVERLYFSPHS